MARDGSGNFSRTVTPPANGDVANATDYNAEQNDVASALSDSINKSGTKAFAANQPMGGFKFTGLGAGSVNGDSVRFEQLASAIAAAVGVTVQGLDATLTALAALTWSSGAPLVQFTAADTISLTLTPSVTSIALARGSTSTPAIPFGGDTNSGIYSGAANQVGVVIAGVLTLNAAPSGVNIASGQLFVGNGTANNPSWAFVNSIGTGAYRIGANNPGFTANGALVFDYNTARLLMASAYDLQRAIDVVTPVAGSVGYIGTIISAFSGTRTVAGVDDGQTLYHTSASAHTLTIDSNANLALPIGFVAGGVNESGGGVVTIAITTDTLRWGSSTGSRSVAANGTWKLTKVAATVWRLEGSGIS